MQQTNTDYTDYTQESANELRRRYPKDKEGVKNEWTALVHHQTEMNSQIAQFERDLRSLRARELGEAYSYQLQEQIQAKEEELRLKQKDAEIMSVQMKQFQMDLLQSKQDKQTLQHILADSYDMLMREQNANNNNDRRRKLDYEMDQLMENRRRIEAEQQYRIQNKRDQRIYMSGQAEELQQKKYQEKQDFLRSRDDYVGQMNQNIQREIQKEENYRDFYKMTTDNQSKLQELHKNRVYSDVQQREQRLRDHVERGVEEVQKKDMDRFNNEQMHRADTMNDLKSTLRLQMEARNQQQGQERMQKTTESAEVSKKLEDYNNYINNMKIEKLQQMRQYKVELDKQSEEQNEINRRNRMSKDEKKINFDDLQAYKTNNPTIQNLLPGLRNSKFEFNGSPTMKTAVEGNFQGTASSPNLHGGAFFSAGNSPHYTGSNRVNTNGSIYQNPSQYYAGASSTNIFAAQQQPQQTQHFGYQTGNSTYRLNTDRSYSMSPTKQVDKKSIFAETFATSTNPGHNPLYNPIPGNIQNPYILKQMQGTPRTRADQQSSYLANIANNNLLSTKSP